MREMPLSVLRIEQRSSFQRDQSLNLHGKGQDVLNVHISF